ncbi:GAF domain-containing protein [Pedobacter sp. AW31-3R]|uniref:GAF domain-containing protein n=1 Tax=Pedobacter sp. AW31-3R TaxID=3445781 RepID=UPI003F9ECFFE
MDNGEMDRLFAVDRFLKLEISKEDELREILEFAAKICAAPIALITLLGKNTQYFKMGVGTVEMETSREHAFCNHTIKQDGVLVVSDTSKDERFVNHPLREQLDIQFYAGAPLITKDGLKLGSLCVIGPEPYQLSEQQTMMLASLSKQVVNIMEFENSVQMLKEHIREAHNTEITLRSLFESSQSCLLLVDLDLKVLFYNKVLSDIMVESFKKPLKAGIVITDIVSDDFMYQFLLNFNKARLGEHVVEEVRYTYPDADAWWHITYDPAYDAENNIIGVSYCATDISDLKLYQQKIMERDQALHTIALIQSHEIRRPVASIIGLTDLFKLNNYQFDREEFHMLELAVKELDDKIRGIVSHTPGK